MSAQRRIKSGLAILAFIFIVGTGGYLIIEEAPILDAVYMVLITITTVGFGEVIELSPTGRLWTAFILVGGFGIALYTAAASIEYLVDLGEVRRRRLMHSQIAKLDNHVILCGWAVSYTHLTLPTIYSV